MNVIYLATFIFRISVNSDNWSVVINGGYGKKEKQTSWFFFHLHPVSMLNEFNFRFVVIEFNLEIQRNLLYTFWIIL